MIATALRLCSKVYFGTSCNAKITALLFRQVLGRRGARFAESVAGQDCAEYHRRRCHRQVVFNTSQRGGAILCPGKIKIQKRKTHPYVHKLPNCLEYRRMKIAFLPDRPWSALNHRRLEESVSDKQCRRFCNSRIQRKSSEKRTTPPRQVECHLNETEEEQRNSALAIALVLWLFLWLFSGK